MLKRIYIYHNPVHEKNSQPLHLAIDAKAPDSATIVQTSSNAYTDRLRFHQLLNTYQEDQNKNNSASDYAERS